MKTNSKRIGKEEKLELRKRHRLECIMQENKERFEVDAEDPTLWRSLTTPGLVLDIDRQSFVIAFPGAGPIESGDVYAWLIYRNRWTFPQALRYLQKREPDPKPPAGPEKAENEIRQQPQGVSFFGDEDKEDSGLYEKGIGWRDGKQYYSYLLKPLDRLQERALEIGGEQMRNYFQCEAWELEDLHAQQPARFIPLQDMDIEECDDCDNPIPWWWKSKPEWELQETFTPGATGATFKRTRIIGDPQIFIFECEEAGEKIYICEDCKRKRIQYREALELLYQSARKRGKENAKLSE